MNVSLLTKYNGNFYPAHGLTRKNRTLRPQAGQVLEAPRDIQGNGPAANKGMSVGHYPAQIKRVGYTELDGSWDQFMLSRFVDLIERNTGSTLDAGAIMRKYDADGDGLLSVDEQTAMIEGLTKADIEREEISRSAAESIVEQLRELSGQNEPKYAAGLLKAVRRYERLFLYENRDTPEEAAVMAV